MDLSERFDVSEAKVAELKARIVRLGLDLRLVEETFARGGGKGGQKINKTANRVELRYPPLGLSVRCQRERRRSVNRFLALRELVDRVEERLRGSSIRSREADKERRRKARRRARARAKLGAQTREGAAEVADRGLL